MQIFFEGRAVPRERGLQQRSAFTTITTSSMSAMAGAANVRRAGAA